MTRSEFFRSRLGIMLAAWIGGLILAALLFIGGLILRWGLLVRLGLVLIAVSMLAQVATRVALYQRVATIRGYTWISLGVRVFGAAFLLYFAAGLRL